MLLDRYLTDLLQLPDAGEFQMQGTGRIYQEGAAVLIEYQSRAWVYWEDFGLTDEELRELGVELPAPPTAPTEAAPPEAAEAPGEHGDNFDQDMSDEYSGRRVLFTLP